MKRIVLFFSIFFFTVFTSGYYSYAQSAETPGFTHLTFNDGLSNNNIKCIAQDGLGYLWVGTEFGLCRYDGNKLSTYYKAKPPIYLPGNNISYIKYLGNDELGISTSEGFQLLNTKTFEYRNFLVSDTGTLSFFQNDTWDCMNMPDNRIGISTATGFYVFNKSGGIYYRYDHYSLADINRRILWGREIYDAGAGNYVIIGNATSYAIYDYSKMKIEVFEQGDSKSKAWPHLASRDWRRIRLSDSELILANQLTDSICYFDFKNGPGPRTKAPFSVVKDFFWNVKARRMNDTVISLNLISGGVAFAHFNTTTKVLIADTVLQAKSLRSFCHFVDTEKRLWVGTKNGLFMQKLCPSTIKQIPMTNLISENMMASTAFYYRNRTYIGCYNRGGPSLKVYNASCDSLLKEIAFYDPASEWNEIVSIVSYSNDTLLLGTRGGTLWLNTKNYRYGSFASSTAGGKFFGLANIKFSPPDASGWAWMFPIHGSQAGRYNIYTRQLIIYDKNSQPALPISDVKHFIRDTKGGTWLGGKGLCRFNEQLTRFDTVITVFAGSNRYSINVANLGADIQSGIWIQTAQNDLIRYDIIKKNYTVLNGATGFPEGNTHALSVNATNNLLVLQSNRLVEYNTEKKTYHTIGRTDNLPVEMPLSENIIYYDNINDRHFLIYPKMVAILTSQPKYIEKTKEIAISEIVFNNERSIFHPGKEVRTSYLKNRITIHYTVTDLEHGNEYVYHYRMDNGDWIFNGYSTTMELGVMPYGAHQISIKTASPKGDAIVTTLQIRIIPPIWKQLWFNLLGIILILAIGVALYRQRIGRLKSKATLDSRIKDLEMKALQVQMNPHFVFNALNSIKEMILTDKKEEASRYLSKFGHMLRLNLEQNNRPFITLKENNQQLHAYLEMEALRFNKFDWSIQLSDDVEENDMLVPPMVVQPFIENAIWHGFLPSNKPLKLSVYYCLREGGLLCEIRDNGIGINQSKKGKIENRYKSFAMSNIKDRLTVLTEKYGKTFSFIVKDISDDYMEKSGTLVVIKVPVLYKTD